MKNEVWLKACVLYMCCCRLPCHYTTTSSTVTTQPPPQVYNNDKEVHPCRQHDRRCVYAGVWVKDK